MNKQAWHKPEGTSRLGTSLKEQAGAWHKRLYSSSSGRFELFPRDSAELVQPDQRFLDQVVGTGSSGGDADHDGARRQPVFRNYFLFLMQVVMENLGVRDKTGCISDKIRRQLF